MLHVGVDEAGYGPLLGPLVIGVAAVRTLDAADEGDGSEGLRARLKGIVVRRPRDGRASASRRLPVPVDDSKVIHRRFGVAGLARGLGALASAIPVAPPADLADLLARFSDRDPGDYAGVPWYEDLSQASVPRYPWTGPLDESFERRGVQAVDIGVLPLSAPELNREFARYDNKARVLGLASGAALLGLLDRHEGEDARVVFDRQGARTDYGGYLADLFPFAAIEERPARRGDARYRVDLPGRTLEVRFATGGDRVSLVVSWASMAAKLGRELFMRCLNAWFAERLEGLRPTAGYVTDGRRWMEDVAPVLEREGLDRAALVRER